MLQLEEIFFYDLVILLMEKQYIIIILVKGKSTKILNTALVVFYVRLKGGVWLHLKCILPEEIPQESVSLEKM